METPQGFVLFGPAHLAILAVLFLAGLLLVYGTRRWASDTAAKWVGISTGVFMLVQDIFDRLGHHYWNGEPFTQVLPFHLCGASGVLAVVLFVTRSRAVYDLLYFWGLAGASMALLTPDIKLGFPHILFITYFSSHALIIIAVAFMTVLYHYRPTIRSLWRAIVLTNVYLVLVIPINLVLDTNFLFLRHKPDGTTLCTFLGPWPWYILSLECLGVVMFFAVYSPYLVSDLLARKRKAALRPEG